tara:strand:+ start:63 stop:1268 length:1206 start_codon:yes stop_codon:yes gene_type:complete
MRALVARQLTAVTILHRQPNLLVGNATNGVPAGCCMTKTWFPKALLALLSFSLLLATSCNKSSPQEPPNQLPTAERSWQMGFAATPPEPTVSAVLQGIDLWSQRSELAVIHEQLPWTDLLMGMTPQEILIRDKVQVVDYMRQRGLRLVFMADLTDGLSRAEEAPQLRALGRSLTEPAVQQLARDYVLAVAALLQPEFLGLSAETNLVRAAAPASIYNAIVTTANAMAADLLTAQVDAVLFHSVQVETAWGLFSNSPYLGIDQDLQDFPFSGALALSSYPYFVFDEPEAIPDDYYTRLADVTQLPLMVIEGGWTSTSVGTVTSSPELQTRYLARHEELLESVAATMWLQLVFADLDLSTYPAPQPVNLPLFTDIGLTDRNFVPKPALAEWDRIFARPLAQSR